MATTISTINESLVDKKVVEALRYILPALDAFSHRVESEGRIQSDSVYVPIATDPTAQSKTAGTLVTANGTVAGSQVQLSNFYAAGWDCNEGKMSPALMPTFWADKAAGAVYSLAKQIVDAALALIVKATYGDTAADKLTVAPADFGQQDLADGWALAETKIKQRQRTLMLNASYAAALMGQSQLALVFANAGDNFLASGMLPRLIGMGTFAYGAFPANAEALGGAIIGKSALLVAVAPPAPLAASGEGDIVERRIITDPQSGLSVLYTMTASGGGSIKGECAVLYGVAAGQNAIVRIVSE